MKFGIQAIWRMGRRTVASWLEKYDGAIKAQGAREQNACCVQTPIPGTDGLLLNENCHPESLGFRTRIPESGPYWKRKVITVRFGVLCG
jgi:hypothetical protein